MTARLFIRIALALSLSAVCVFALPADDQMQFADGMYLRGLYEMAIKEYLVLLRDHPDYAGRAAATFRIAECYRKLDDKKGAERFFKMVMAEYPESEYRPRAEFRRAELFATGGQHLDAVNLFRALLESDPPEDIRASAHYYLGYCLDKLRLSKEAEESFRLVIAEYPDSPFFSYACLGLADLYKRTSKSEAKPLELYEQALAAPASDRVAAEALFQIGDLSFRAGNHARAADSFERLLAEYPDDPRVAESRLQAAWSFHNAGRHESALELARQSLDDFTLANRDQWRYLAANCLRQLDRTADALAEYDRLLRDGSSSQLAPAAAYEKALIQFRSGDYQALVDQAAGVRPGVEVEQDYAWLLGEANLAVSNHVEAIGYFRNIVEKFPEGPHAPAAAFRVGAIQQAQGFFEQASISYRRLVEAYPDAPFSADALRASAFCRVKAGQDKEAIRDWDALLKAHPDLEDTSDILYDKAMAEVRGQNDRDAKKTLEELLKRFPDSSRSAEAHYWLGSLAERAGREAAAEKALRRAIEQSDDPDLTRRAQFRLATILQKRDKLDEAADLLQGLLDPPAVESMPPELLEWLTRYRLAQPSPAQALAASQALLDAAPDPAWKQIGAYLLGIVQLDSGRRDDAIASLRIAIAQPVATPDAPDAALRLADALLEKGEDLDAREAYTFAAEKAGEADLVSIRARAYAGLGDVAFGREDWAQATRLYMSVAVLFDDPTLTPRCLARAAEAFEKMGRTVDRDRALAELAERYPDAAPPAAESNEEPIPD